MLEGKKYCNEVPHPTGFNSTYCANTQCGTSSQNYNKDRIFYNKTEQTATGRDINLYNGN